MNEHSICELDRLWEGELLNLVVVALIVPISQLIAEARIDLHLSGLLVLSVVFTLLMSSY